MEYSDGELNSQKVLQTTLMTIQMPLTIPKFKLYQEKIFLLIYHIAGYRYFTLPNHPEFNKHFHLMGPIPDKIKRFFTDELVLFFKSSPYYRIESNGSSLLIFPKQRIAAVKEVKELLNFGRRLKEVVLESTVSV